VPAVAQFLAGPQGPKSLQALRLPVPRKVGLQPYCSPPLGVKAGLCSLLWQDKYLAGSNNRLPGGPAFFAAPYLLAASHVLAVPRGR
jgi:hypothetical protein